MSDSIFIFSHEQLQQLAQDVLRYAAQKGASDAAVDFSEGNGLSVSVRKRKVETIEQNQDKGKNLGQGLAGITDKQRRDLAGRGDDAPTKDQSDRATSGEHGRQKGGKDGDTTLG